MNRPQPRKRLPKKNAKYDLSTGTLCLRVPSFFEESFGKYVNFPLKFREEDEEKLQASLALKTAISYRFREK